MRSMYLTPFAPAWFVFLALMVAVTVGIHRALRNRDESVKRRWLPARAVTTWAISTTFTFGRVADAAFPEFTFVEAALPLHFCTIATILLIPGVWFRRGWFVGPLKALLFFPGAAAAFLALASPAAEYLNQPIWSWNSWFFLIHALNVVVPCLLVSLGFYRPRLVDALWGVLWFFVVAMAVLPVVAILRFGLGYSANYYFFFDPEGADIFQILWDNLGGIPVLYQLPLLVLIIPVFVGMYYLYRLVARCCGEPRWVSGVVLSGPQPTEIG
jgi:hypothetical protein